MNTTFQQLVYPEGHRENPCGKPIFPEPGFQKIGPAEKRPAMEPQDYRKSPTLPERHAAKREEFFSKPNLSMPIKNPTFPSGKAGAVCFFILLFFSSFLLYLFSKGRKSSVTKSDLSRQYGVDKKTFCKWVKFFLNDDIDFDCFQKIRVVPFDMLAVIYLKFGFPSDASKAILKAEIIEKGEGNYRSLRQSISTFPQNYVVSAQQFSAFNVFPPNIGRAILAQYQ